EPQSAAPTPGTEGANPPDEPRLDITEIKTSDGHSLPFGLDDQTTTLRVYLHEPVQPGGSTAVRIKIKGTVPDIDPEETSLVTHVMRQVSAAIKNEREVRRARELNFRSRGVMLLGTAFPLLAVHDGDDWRRKIEPSIGELVFSEAADYQVTVSVGSGVSVYTP